MTYVLHELANTLIILVCLQIKYSIKKAFRDIDIIKVIRKSLSTVEINSKIANLGYGGGRAILGAVLVIARILNMKDCRFGKISIKLLSVRTQSYHSQSEKKLDSFELYCHYYRFRRSLYHQHTLAPLRESL